jgi:hypothetical protein
MVKRKSGHEPIQEPSNDSSSDYDSDDSASENEPEVTLNILERQPRITAGM